MNPVSKKFYRICLEGNLACGKSTLLNSIIKRYPLAIVDDNHQSTQSKLIDYNQETEIQITSEPLIKWTNVGLSNENLLKRMYDNPKRWAFTFENYSQNTRLEQMVNAVNDFRSIKNDSKNKIRIQLMERSIFSNRFVFIENFFRTNQISKVEYEILDQWFREINQAPETFVDVFLYIRTEPKIVLERIKHRARTEEEQIPLEYLENIHQLQEELFNNKELLNIPQRSQVILINGNQAVDLVQDEFFKKFDSWLNSKTTSTNTNLN